MLAPARSRCRFVEAQEASGMVRRSECPKRGTADKPGVKTRVWRTTFRFTEEKHPRRNGCACAIAYSKNPRMAVITRSTWSSVSSGYIGKGWMRRLTASVTG